MSASSSRMRVLERIRASAAGTARRDSTTFAGAAADARTRIPRDYIRRGSLDSAARVTRMIERLREYDAEVTECTPDGLASEIAAQLAGSGRKTFVAPSGVSREWLAAGFNWKIDGEQTGELAIGEIERCDGVLTACFCGVADSGTIVLHHSASEGRRVVTLLPDWHLCVLCASQIVETLPEYFDRCGEAGNEGARERGNEKTGNGVQGTGVRDQGDGKLPSLVTWISGPSATADIEMTRIKGVHGPRFLNVIIVKDGKTGN
jgi:L-lactate dehydrogenase complex protein LldG